MLLVADNVSDSAGTFMALTVMKAFIIKQLHARTHTSTHMHTNGHCVADNGQRQKGAVDEMSIYKTKYVPL